MSADYSAPQSKRPARDRLRRRGDRLYLTDANELLLQQEYAVWLERVGVAAFGPPLDHGPDAGEADGDPGQQHAEALASTMQQPAGVPRRGLRAVPSAMG